MKISWTTVLNILVAMAIWAVLDALFLGDLLANVTKSFEQVVS